MKIYEIISYLTEDRAEFLAAKFDTRIMAAYNADASAKSMSLNLDSPLSVLRYIESKIGPSPYIDWITNRYIRNEFSLSGLDKLSELFVWFNKIKPILEPNKRDIAFYKTFAELKAVVDSNKDKDLRSKKEIEREYAAKMYKESTVFHKSSDLTIVIPQSIEASKFFGKGTKWCTAANESNMFNSYHEYGPLFILMTAVGEKFQFQFETASYMDDTDTHIANTHMYELIEKYDLKTIFKYEAKSFNILPLKQGDFTIDDYIGAITQTDDDARVVNFMYMPIDMMLANDDVITVHIEDVPSDLPYVPVEFAIAHREWMEDTLVSSDHATHLSYLTKDVIDAFSETLFSILENEMSAINHLPSHLLLNNLPKTKQIIFDSSNMAPGAILELLPDNLFKPFYAEISEFIKNDSRTFSLIRGKKSLMFVDVFVETITKNKTFDQVYFLPPEWVSKNKEKMIDMLKQLAEPQIDYTFSMLNADVYDIIGDRLLEILSKHTGFCAELLGINNSNYLRERIFLDKKYITPFDLIKLNPNILNSVNVIDSRIINSDMIDQILDLLDEKFITSMHKELIEQWQENILIKYPHMIEIYLKRNIKLKDDVLESALIKYPPALKLVGKNVNAMAVAGAVYDVLELDFENIKYVPPELVSSNTVLSALEKTHDKLRVLSLASDIIINRPVLLNNIIRVLPKSLVYFNNKYQSVLKNVSYHTWHSIYHVIADKTLFKYIPADILKELSREK